MNAAIGIASGFVAPPSGASSARTSWRWHRRISPCPRSPAEQGDEADKAKHIGALQLIPGVGRTIQRSNGSEGATVKKAKPKQTIRRAEPPGLHPSFAAVVRTFIRDQRVTFGGQGIGSRALKLDGKIFAMLNSAGSFVVKLPRARVATLVAAGRGWLFDPVHGRPMKEWLVVDGRPTSWLRLAREAYEYARANARSAGSARVGATVRG